MEKEKHHSFFFSLRNSFWYSLEHNSMRALLESLHKYLSCHSAEFLKNNAVMNRNILIIKCLVKPKEKIGRERSVLFKLLKEHYRQDGANSNITA